MSDFILWVTHCVKARYKPIEPVTSLLRAPKRGTKRCFGAPQRRRALQKAAIRALSLYEVAGEVSRELHEGGQSSIPLIGRDRCGDLIRSSSDISNDTFG